VVNHFAYTESWQDFQMKGKKIMTAEEFSQAENDHAAFLNSVRDFASRLVGTRTSAGLPITESAVNGALRDARVPALGEDAQPVTMEQLFGQRASEREAHRESIRSLAVQIAADGDMTTSTLQEFLTATASS
jgi:hypothetical protein